MAGRQRTGAQEAFMRWALATILSAPGHPLAFLVDATTKAFHSQLGSRRRDALKNEHFPPVQAGHLTSFHSLDDAAEERLALQDADFNQEQNYGIESRGRGAGRPFVVTTAVGIGGVPVERATAGMWERLGLLPPGTVAGAKLHPGWSRSG